jgi:hypothetical protein
VTDKYQWGKTYFTANGIVNSEEIRVNRMKRQDGETAHYADAYANDQDWSLMYWLLVNEKK